MATGSLAPFVKWAAFDSNGDPAAGWHLFTYIAGTATKQATYTDIALMNGNTNPIVLDSAGRATIFLLPGTSYKFVLQEAATDPPTSPEWTQDNIESTPASAGNVDVAGVAGENLTGGDAVYLSQGDGGRTNGAYYKADSDVDYSTALARVVAVCVNTVTSGNTGSFRLSGLVTGLSGLVAGSTYYASSTPGAFATSGGTFPRRYGVAQSATALALQPTDRDAGSSDGGIISTTAQNIPGIKTFDEPPLYYPGTQTTTTSTLTGTIYADGVPHTTTGTTIEDLASFRFLGGEIDATGKGFTLRTWGKYLNNGNNKRTVVDLAGADIIDVTTASNNKTWDIEVEVMRTAAGTATCNAVLRIGGSAVDDSTPAVIGATYETVIEALVVFFTSGSPFVRLRAADSVLAGGTTVLGFVVKLF